MKTIVLPVGPLQENTYIHYDEKTLEAVVVDPGNEPETIIDRIKKENLNIKAILLTHGHFDHIEAVAPLKARFDVPVAAHQDEAAILAESTLNFSAFHGSGALTLVPDVLLADGEVFLFGENELTVLHTPGHTPGGVCYYAVQAGVLFTGDTLFCEEIGRTDFSYGDMHTLITVIKSKLLTLPADVRVLPGHGQESTIGHEKKTNPYLR